MMKVGHTYETVTRWSDLDWEDKRHYRFAINTLSTFLDRQESAILTWTMIDSNLDIKHLYKFSFDELKSNAAQRNKTLYFDDLGLHLVDGMRHIVEEK